MKIPRYPTYFRINRTIGLLPLMNFTKQFTCMSGRLPFIRSQLNPFGDCFIITEMTKEQTLKFLSEHNIDTTQCEFLKQNPNVLDIYYDRVNRF